MVNCDWAFLKLVSANLLVMKLLLANTFALCCQVHKCRRSNRKPVDSRATDPSICLALVHLPLSNCRAAVVLPLLLSAL